MLLVQGARLWRSDRLRLSLWPTAMRELRLARCERRAVIADLTMAVCHNYWR